MPRVLVNSKVRPINGSGKIDIAFYQRVQRIQPTLRALVHEPGRGAPIGLIQYEDGVKFIYVPRRHNRWRCYRNRNLVEIKVGNIMQIDNVPEGTYVFNIEGSPFDGGKFIRGSGTYGIITTHEERHVSVRMPSGQTRKILERLSMLYWCRFRRWSNH